MGNELVSQYLMIQWKKRKKAEHKEQLKTQFNAQRFQQQLERTIARNKLNEFERRFIYGINR